MKTLRSLLAFLAVLGAMQAEEVEITILHTSDIHAHIGEHARDHEGGDWLRMATLLQEHRAAAGGVERTLLIDTGDTIQGTLPGALSRGDFIAPMLAGLQYDAWIPGNHELDFGVPRLRELLHQVRVPILCGNLTVEGAPELASWRMVERQGARVAIIGMTNAFLPNWFIGPLYEGYAVEPALTAIERIMPELLRARPHMIILGIHQGFTFNDERGVNEVREIAWRFPQIDLILGAHTSRRFAGMRVGQSWYVQPGEHATEFAGIVARIDTRKGQLLTLDSRLYAVPRETPVDETLAATVSSWLEATDRLAAQAITTPPLTITSSGTPGIDCHMSELLARAIAARTDAVAALHGRLTGENWPANEPVTEDALFRAIPYENYTCVAWFTREELRAIIAEQLRMRSSYTYNGIWGVSVTADRDSGEVIELTLPDGGHWPVGERRPVAFTSYNAAGGGGRYPQLRAFAQQPAARLQVLEENSRETVRAYLRGDTQWHAPPLRWIRWAE